MRTLVALAVRDRAPLVDACLRSLAAARIASSGGAALDWRVVAWLDPEDRETGGWWLVERGVDEVLPVDLSHGLSGSARVFSMRAAAAKFARANRYDRLLFLDSDVVLSDRFALEFERLWPHVEGQGCGALSLGNYAGYEQHEVERLPELGATVRRFGLGACLAFPVARLVGVPDAAAAAWDTHFSRAAAGHRVLTSDISYVRHDGCGSGLSGARARQVQFQRLAPDLLP